MRIGRALENDLVLNNPLCSRRHACIERRDAGLFLLDENSTFGTFLNGRPAAADRIAAGDRIQVGTQELEVASADAVLILLIQEASDADRPAQASTLFQQRVEPHSGGITLYLQTAHSNTSFAGPAGRKRKARLADGDRLSIGPEQFAVWNGDLQRLPFSGMRIDVTGIEKRAGTRPILHPVSLAVKPGEFVGLLGPSGAGKTSLLRILAGLEAPAAGCVYYDAVPLDVRPNRALSGFVPQDDMLAELLTPRETVRFAVALNALRLPVETDIARKSQSLLDVLELNECAGRPVRFLSGGQRKRVSLAMEMAADPRVLALDEPTANLDPVLEAKTMELLRRISDRRRTVLVSTHRLSHVQEFDLVGLMHQGRLIFFGPPAVLGDYFGCREIADIYRQIEGESSATLSERFRTSPLHRDYVESRLKNREELFAEKDRAAECRLSRRPSGLGQLALLCHRTAILLRRDAAHWLLTLGQAPLIGGLIFLVFGRNTNQWPLLFCMGISCIWFGCINSVKEICKEHGLLQRERRMGLRPGPYLLAKFTFLAVLALVQTGILVFLVNTAIPLEGAARFHLLSFSIVALAATAMGLAISAIAQRTERALAALPLALIPQILFAGAVAPFDEMPAVSRFVSRFTVSRWNFTASKKVTLGLVPGDEWLALSALAVLCIFLAFFALHRKGRSCN